MALECESGRPVGVAAAGPRRLAPARVHEIDWLGDGVVTEHLAEDGQELGFGDVVGLGFDTVGLVGHHGGEEDAAAG